MLFLHLTVFLYYNIYDFSVCIKHHPCQCSNAKIRKDRFLLMLPCKYYVVYFLQKSAFLIYSFQLKLILLNILCIRHEIQDCLL